MPRAPLAFLCCTLCAAAIAIACGGGAGGGPSTEGPVTPVVIAALPDAGAIPASKDPPPRASPAVAEEPHAHERERQEEDDIPLTPPPQGQSGSAPFDRGFAARVLSQVNVSMCAAPNGPRGPGRVTVTFHPSGNVQAVSIDSPPYRGTSVGACIAAQFAQIQIPPFSGTKVTVGKSFILF